jgi:tetratricopeptide (TPR) repeat protein
MDAAAGPLVLARHDLSRGRPDRALAALAGATGAELEEREFWVLRAQALYELRRWDEAADAAHAGLEREPEDLGLLDALALAELERGRSKEAVKTIDAAISLAPDFAVLHAHRGLILARRTQKTFRLSSYKKARAAVNEALRLDPDCEDALRVRAQIALLSGDRRAQEYGAELLAVDPEDEWAHLLAGEARSRRGDVSAALDHYDEAARLNPSDPELAALGRQSRAMRGWFAAPMRFADRLTRGQLRLVWPVVAIATFSAGLPLLSALVFGFWLYSWAAHFYLRRVGRTQG